jgi:hypothetical protein
MTTGGPKHYGKSQYAKYNRIRNALQELSNGGKRTFTALELAKAINETTVSTGLYLRFYTGVRKAGPWVWEFTGGPIGVCT